MSNTNFIDTDKVLDALRDLIRTHPEYKDELKYCFNMVKGENRNQIEKES